MKKKKKKSVPTAQRQWASKHISTSNIVEMSVWNMSSHRAILNWYHEHQQTDLRSPLCSEGGFNLTQCSN